MPGALSNSQDYQFRQHRRPSTTSQTSLPDQPKTIHIQSPYSPNRSAGFLPATTYTYTNEPRDRSRTPSLSDNVQRTNGFPISPPRNNARYGSVTTSNDPDEYYRQYQDPFLNSGTTSPVLHQEAFRSIPTHEPNTLKKTRSESVSTAGSSGRQPAKLRKSSGTSTSLPGIKSRKASVRNLVAQINATAVEELPPVPTIPYSRSGSRAQSPVLNSTHSLPFTSGHRNASNTTFPQSSNTFSDHDQSQQDYGPNQSTPRRPLFGEVFALSNSSAPSPGYGIVNARRRAGSEASPMHSPNPMFSETDARDSQLVLSPIAYRRVSEHKPEHRRHHSDLPVPASTMSANSSASNHTNSPLPPLSERRPPTASRIPISTRRLSTASDSGSSNPASRAPSSMGKHKTSNEPSAKISARQNGKSAPPMELNLSGKITSPGRRGKPTSIPAATKSPLLRANIIAPPPKISPPLRSSRPRMPVSSASTAASRARMAEKFEAMQKLNNDKRNAARKSRPPELTDIDLKARRLRITQAITKSKEGEALRGSFQTGRRWEPSRSPGLSPLASEAGFSPQIPELNVESVEDDDCHDQDSSFQRQDSADYEEADLHFATESALQAMQNDTKGRTETHGDSPTLGRHDSRFDQTRMQIQTQFLDPPDCADPTSAVTNATAETEGTNIDPEPQQGSPDQASLLHHVMSLRSHDSVPSQDHSPQHRDLAYRHDRADVESVNLILRNTTYLDEEEAIQKGYATAFVPPEPVPEINENKESPSRRDSWTSSIPNDDTNSPDETHYFGPRAVTQHRDLNESPEETDSYRNTMASDAYTIVNIVLQHHSDSGIVDQQFVDDVYHRIIETSPEVEQDGGYDPDRIEALCLEEMHRRGTIEAPLVPQVSQYTDDEADNVPQNEREIPQSIAGSQYHVKESREGSMLLTLPTTTFQGHRHKSSLDSADDWANTSPSVGDWMRFASDNTTPEEDTNSAKSLQPSFDANEGDTSKDVPSDSRRSSVGSKRPSRLISLDIDEDKLGPDDFGVAIIRPPSHSPPLPPKDNIPSIEATYQSSTPESASSSVRQLPVPFRVTSLGQIPPAPPRQTASTMRTEVAPWEAHEVTETPSSPEAKRLKQRRHVLKELVDTEFTYERDMRVLCDIYMQTASAALSDEDIRTLFGNIEDIQVFSRDFLSALKLTSKAAVAGDRPEQRKDKKDNKETLPGQSQANSSNSTIASSTKVVEPDVPDSQRDRETRIGEAFESRLEQLEGVYSEYIKNRHAANQRLEVLQRNPVACEWLKECRENSSDITNAWNLDALLVKPVQRITKYPLLLKELIDSTPEDHPDLGALRHAFTSIADMNFRINEVKKHAELVDSAFNSRKRGQSDSRTGFSKAFGRRAEKLKQHVGMTDMYEDSEYNEIRRLYDNNIAQLMVVLSDCQNYERGINAWVQKMIEISAAAEAWVDVSHSHHQQAESKLRQLAIVVKRISTIALPDHLEHLSNKVLQPMVKTVEMLNKFKDDPKGLLVKRDKRLVDYAQMKHKQERGEKVDKKTSEKIDQWEALNTEAKERMKKLLRATAHLVQTCQGHLVRLQMSWMDMFQSKLSNALGIPLFRLEPEEITKDWHLDFDHWLAQALTLSVCNGSLVLEAANMASFLTPSTTLVDEDSPRQSSWSSVNKRSISLHSESSTVPTLESSSRPSGTYSTHAIPSDHFDRPYPYPNGRTRAASSTPGMVTKGHEPPPKPVPLKKTSSAISSIARPMTSPSIAQDGFQVPHLNVDPHSPFQATFSREEVTNRPASAATFFSTATQPVHNVPTQRSAGSGIFSSAMPMSDSPVNERVTIEDLSPSPQVLFTAASVYEFNIDRDRREAGFPYLTYVTGEIFDVIGERGELWLAKNQDDPHGQIGWIWNKHFAKLQS